VVAVVAGGIGTIAVAVIWSQLFPGLRNQRGLGHAMSAVPTETAPAE
jgi:hypothetical protein